LIFEHFLLDTLCAPSYGRTLRAWPSGATRRGSCTPLAPALIAVVVVDTGVAGVTA